MQVGIHGSLHKELGIKNQDACRELKSNNTIKSVRIICDGCTNIDANDSKTFKMTHSEVGAGLFCSLYEILDDPYDYDKFPENANLIMEKMLQLIDFEKEKINEFSKKIDYILHNYCFTILAVFEKEDSFIVYFLGDGVIILKNKFDTITYFERKNGNAPPYLVNNYLLDEDKKVLFEKYIFSKKEFKNVGIASDGIEPFLGKDLTNTQKLFVDSCLKHGNNMYLNNEKDLSNFILQNPDIFCDDITIVW